MSLPAIAMLVIAAGLLLAWTAFVHHPVGDYFTESDFYGGYALGARLIQHGTLDFSRYSVVGPVHELLLAGMGWVTRDLFVAARLISIAAAVATLALIAATLRARIGGALAFWTVAIVATNSYFFQYGYSATTEMVSLAFQAACLYALLARPGAGAPFMAGVCAALATLTRFSSVVIVPAGLISLAWLAPVPNLRVRRSVVLFVLGFALPAGVWTILSVSAGHVPGANLVQGFAFYANPSTTRNVQDTLGGLEDSTRAYGLGSSGLREVLSPARLGLNVLDHFQRNGRDLLGVPVVILAAVGLVLLIRDRRGRQLLPFLLPAAFLFAVLIPVFYSNRYALALVPAYAALAASIADSPSLAFITRRLRFPVSALLVAAAVVWSARASVAHQRHVQTQLPVEVLEMGAKLRSAASTESRIVSRKGQIGYYADLEVVAFPRVKTLADLARECRLRNAGLLYFSWYEAELRPEFWHLLDTSGAVPGLDIVHATEKNPAVVYRIGPGFGTAPSWFANDTLVRVHTARAQVKVLPWEMVWRENFFLAAWDAQHGAIREARLELEAVLRGNPGYRPAEVALARIRAAEKQSGPRLGR